MRELKGKIKNKTNKNENKKNRNKEDDLAFRADVKGMLCRRFKCRLDWESEITCAYIFEDADERKSHEELHLRYFHDKLKGIPRKRTKTNRFEVTTAFLEQMIEEYFIEHSKFFCYISSHLLIFFFRYFY